MPSASRKLKANGLYTEKLQLVECFTRNIFIWFFRYKRLRAVYVRRGIEELRKLEAIKTKKMNELNENVHLLRTELVRRTDEVLKILERFEVVVKGKWMSTTFSEECF